MTQRFGRNGWAEVLVIPVGDAAVFTDEVSARTCRSFMLCAHFGDAGVRVRCAALQ